MEFKLHGMGTTYPLICERGLTKRCFSYIPKGKKVLVVTDKNIPEEYYADILKNAMNSSTIVLEPGEESKTFENFLLIQKKLVEMSFSRSDVIVSVGGGVISDLTGFVASTFKRGITWISIPTSSLAMIDASVGGKTAVDFDSIKNVIGTFYNPSLMLFDMDTLKSLPKRELTNGLFEALKMGFVMDEKILPLMYDYQNNLEEIIIRSVLAKDEVVAIDPKETNMRRILNLGHTVGHALESYYLGTDKLKHGEAVGYGMKFTVSKKFEKTLNEISTILNLPSIDVDETKTDVLLDYIKNDKKVIGDSVSFVFVNDKGETEIKPMNKEETRKLILKEVTTWHQ